MTRLLALGTLVAALSLAACSDPPKPLGAGAPSSVPADRAAPPENEPVAPPGTPAVAREGAVEGPAAPAAEAGALAREGAPVAAPHAPAPAPSAASLLREAVALDPTGPVPLAHESETVVDPAATFRVELAAEIPDGRLVLLDVADAIVPSSGTREVGATTRFTLSPAAPLVPGSRYVLRLDGARSREIEDAAGRSFAPVGLTVLVAGEPPKPEPKPAPRKKRRGR